MGLSRLSEHIHATCWQEQPEVRRDTDVERLLIHSRLNGIKVCNGKFDGDQIYPLTTDVKPGDIFEYSHTTWHPMESVTIPLIGFDEITMGGVSSERNEYRFTVDSIMRLGNNCFYLRGNGSEGMIIRFKGSVHTKTRSALRKLADHIKAQMPDFALFHLM